MADDSGNDVGMAIGTALGGASIAIFAGASCWLGMKAYRAGQFSRGWRRARVWALGGVTTLEQALAYDCAMCGRSLDQREEVRTLSCGHVFHLRKGPKCASRIDDWLRENRMRCPACCKPVHSVLPWKAPPTSAPPPAPVPPPAQSEASSPASDLEAQEEERRRLSLPVPAPSEPSSSTSNLVVPKPRRRLPLEQVPPQLLLVDGPPGLSLPQVPPRPRRPLNLPFDAVPGRATV